MPDSRRNYRRSDLQIGAAFRPTYGATEYSRGTAVNLSCEGLGLDAPDFRFILYENLELVVELFGSGDTVTIFGDIMWKRQDGKKCRAGIKFRMKDKNMQKSLIERVYAASKIPVSEIYARDPDYIICEAVEKVSVYQPAVLHELPPEPLHKLGFIKQYHDSGAKCRVTFRLLREAARNTQNVRIVGDFNNWDTSQSPMTQLRNGDFVITMDLPSKREYRYRYLLDGHRWENDWYADKFVPNEFGSKDSVVIV